MIGYDATIAWCCAAGNFELNVMMPVMAWDLLDSIELLAAGSTNFATRLVDGLAADRDRVASFIEQSLGISTALAPEIGYERAAALVKEAYATGRTVREVAREKSGLSEERLAELRDATAQAGLGTRIVRLWLMRRAVLLGQVPVRDVGQNDLDASRNPF